MKEAANRGGLSFLPVVVRCERQKIPVRAGSSGREEVARSFDWWPL